MEYFVIGLLGPLSVQVGGVPVAPSAGQQRRLMALLAANLGREVGMAAIEEELWAGRPPGRPAAAVQTYVKELRRRIGDAVVTLPDAVDPKQILSRGHGGYRLGGPGAVLDVHDFERSVRDASRALAAGDHEEASRRLTAGLALWRGRALDDVRGGGALRAEALRLDELRLTALETRIGADLHLGRHARLISELTALTSLHPFQENLHGQLMLALHRSGRQSRALDVYRCLRARFVRELGIEPSRRLRALHRSVLAADPALDPPALAGLAS
ncbi:AfsR/SARP family transcriptional regulator [Streptomyces sp. RFCAC02]|uniref:AfsR/SARP family transcriptional regulator n=1 Tax=Streptomyces sp. RFCAC02 TaxID=2499143 RepID=UPI001F1042F5|nr:AfsR/SARP family transcriptional regulator [Streptomyces sp. RFCAC02]